MKKIVLFLSTVMLVVINVACKKSNDMNLFIKNHLNDSEHIGSQDVYEQKVKVLDKLTQFDDWYRKYSGSIIFNPRVEIWNIGWDIDVDDEFRISFLKDSVIPRFKDCTYLSQKVKDKINKDSQLEDPGNIGFMMSGSDYGKGLSRFTAMNNSEEYYIFHTANFLDNEEHSDDPDFSQELRDISYDEAMFYHLSFVKIVNDKKAIYKVHTDITNNYIRPETFLIVELILEKNDWLVDDVYYIEPDQLIENEKGYCILLDYFENKEAYETGISKP